MDFGLEDKVALVVDSHLAIPNAAAVALAQEGAVLSLTAPDNYSMRHVELELARRHIPQERFHSVIANLEQERDIRRLVRETLRHRLNSVSVNAISVLVTTVQEMAPAPASGLADDQIQPALVRNFMAAVHLTREVLPNMKRQGSGRIINLIPFTAMESSPRTALSSLSMAPALAYFKGLSAELACENITVNNIIYAGVRCDRNYAAPPASGGNGGNGNGNGNGGAASETHPPDANANADAAAPDDETGAEMLDSLPMRRMGQPKEIGDIVCMVASAQASYLTGANIVVDGGSHYNYV